MTTPPRFPDAFVWGAATSAYQVEGSPLADGAGPSIWHRFSHTPGRILDGTTGDVACDHYRRFRDDVALMRVMGLTAYRFSVSWSRVLPEGRGRVNRAGLAFYEQLVDALLEQDIQPFLTLYHWDLPAALDDRGGWLNPDVAGWFADYAGLVVRTLDDRVKRWVTLNEPWVVMDGGYMHGILAPGHRNRFEAPIVTHNLLRAHGAAVQAYRAEGRNEVGLVVNLEPKYPASDHPEDIAATARAEAYMNRQYLDPVLLGAYPDALREMFGEAWPEWPASDMSLIGQPIDFVGVNYYSRTVTRDASRESALDLARDGVGAVPASVFPVRAMRVRQGQHAHTTMDWEVFPQGLEDTLRWVRERYGALPLYVTENGAAFYDPPIAHAERVDDPLRVAYFRDHLRAVQRAIAAGVDVRGYFAWSLLDNFEWSYGYAQRFGIVHVDFATQRRTLKASARFYADVVRSHGGALAP